jgi:hypothetical protein
VLQDIALAILLSGSVIQKEAVLFEEDNAFSYFLLMPQLPLYDHNSHLKYGYIANFLLG